MDTTRMSLLNSVVPDVPYSCLRFLYFDQSFSLPYMRLQYTYSEPVQVHLTY